MDTNIATIPVKAVTTVALTKSSGKLAPVSKFPALSNVVGKYSFKSGAIPNR